MALQLRYATLTQLGNAFRDRFRKASKEEAWRLANWLLNRIADGTFTDNQVRNFFNLTVAEYNSFKTRLQTMQSRWLELQSAAGE